MTELGFDKYVDELKEFMDNYNEKEDESKRITNKKRKNEEGIISGEGEDASGNKKFKENNFKNNEN